MKEVYLSFVENQNDGNAPSSVTFCAQRSKPTANADVYDNTKIVLSHVLKTKDTPRQVLEKLVKVAFDAVAKKPSFSDILRGWPEKDDDPECADYPRQVGYLADGDWPRLGETQEQATKKAEENTAKRNAKLLEVYSAFVKSVSAEQISNSTSK